jgi:hypothetical protein
LGILILRYIIKDIVQSIFTRMTLITSASITTVFISHIIVIWIYCESINRSLLWYRRRNLYFLGTTFILSCFIDLDSWCILPSVLCIILVLNSA